MATLTEYGLGLEDMATQIAPDGTLLPMVDALKQTNSIIQDGIFLPANAPFANKGMRLTKEPRGTVSKLNQGVATSRPQWENYMDNLSLIKALSESDVDVIDASPSPEGTLNIIARTFVNGIGKTLCAHALYGNSTYNSSEMYGVASRLNSISNSANVLNAGGSGSDLTSMYIITWEPDGAHFLYPRGDSPGLEHVSNGKVLVADPNDANAKIEVYQDYFKVKLGFGVGNEKAIGRIANIETSGASNIFDEEMLVFLKNRMYITPNTKIYVNETIMSQMQIRLTQKSNVYFSKEDGLDGGGPVMRFDGVEVRKEDQILITESAIS